jgi:hypothetical protein
VLDVEQTARVKKPNAREPSYEADHLQKYTEHGLQWPPRWEEGQDGFGGRVGYLPRRVQEVVCFLEQVHQEEIKAGIEVYADVSLSIGCCRARRGSTPCIVSTSRIWGLHLGRELAGEELLALQGFSLEAQRESTTWTPKQLADLAGNAFNGAVLAPLLTAALAFYPWGQAGAQVPRSLAKADSAISGMDGESWCSQGRGEGEDELKD